MPKIRYSQAYKRIINQLNRFIPKCLNLGIRNINSIFLLRR
ncbi:hypothetical protein BMETH_2624_0 [methanotrophic bacterial endosymbiont of Bathymodiolus sp.]|nr:hypothetical protein BMETH_2624_0 [methanotrophic bacterial endosymbiont of Bathymodiolus sp.]